VVRTIPVADGPVAPWLDRLIAATTAACGVGCIVLLLRATPDPRGYNTHVALPLGIPPCGWPLRYGIPCPTCGVTTAACEVVHGHLLQAFVVQPFGALLALAGIAATVISVACLCRGRSTMDLVARLPYGSLLLAGLGLLLGSWLYKYLTFVPPP